MIDQDWKTKASWKRYETIASKLKCQESYISTCDSNIYLKKNDIWQIIKVHFVLIVQNVL